MKKIRLTICGISLFCGALFADSPVIERHASGLLARYTSQGATERGNIDAAMGRFFSKYFPREKNVLWKKKNSLPDGTHVHLLYELEYRGRRVVDQYLKAHYNREGFLETAESSWEIPFTDSGIPDGPRDLRESEQRVQAWAFKKFRNRSSKISTTAVIYIDPRTHRPRNALDVRYQTFRPLSLKHWILDETTLQLLEERRTLRDATNFVYPIDPMPASPALASLAFGNLTSGSALESSAFTVERVEDPSTPTVVSIDYTVDFSSTFDTSAASYTATYTCTGTSADCPNQGFDGVNVYYHLDGYRTKINGYLSTLGATLTFPHEPLRVFVNSVFLDEDLDGIPDSNNAFFYPASCVDSTPDSYCLIFLRPEIAACNGVDQQFNDLAREGNVIVHEYQHYITDNITQMVGGSTSSPNVGDMLHEGYSDYFGASHITDTSGQNATVIGQYGFENCPTYSRDIGSLRIYANGEEERDPHVAGQTWASGLWQLRTEFGTGVVDLIALKSEFFLSVKPGFVDAVEALASADKALYGGIHTARIRKLFYDELHFIGGKTGVFRDAETKLAEVGMKSCAGVNDSNFVTSSSFLSWSAFLSWLGGLLFLGRRVFRGRRD